MDQHPPLLFDIDNTLLNTKILKLLFLRQLSTTLSLSMSQLETSLKEYTSQLSSSTDFSPQAFANFLSQKFTIPQSQVIEVFQGSQIYQQSLYPETLSNLSQLHSHFQLGIFSEGEPSYQHQKLRLSGLLPFFSPNLTFIFPRKLTATSISQLPPHSIIIDDKVEVITSLPPSQFTAIWLNRHTSPTSQLRSISSLSDLPNLLHELL